MEFITAYGPKRKVRTEPGTDGRTRQEMKAECDINNIMKKYERTGLIDHVARHDGQYGEYAVNDYHTAMNTVVAAREMFETVPSAIRARFGNDPGAFIDFVNDEANAEEMVKLGLRKAPSFEEPAPARQTAPEGDTAGESAAPV